MKSFLFVYLQKDVDDLKALLTEAIATIENEFGKSLIIDCVTNMMFIFEHLWKFQNNSGVQLANCFGFIRYFVQSFLVIRIIPYDIVTVTSGTLRMSQRQFLI